MTPEEKQRLRTAIYAFIAGEGPDPHEWVDELEDDKTHEFQHARAMAEVRALDLDADVIARYAERLSEQGDALWEESERLMAEAKADAATAVRLGVPGALEQLAEVLRLDEERKA